MLWLLLVGVQPCSGGVRETLRALSLDFRRADTTLKDPCSCNLFSTALLGGKLQATLA